MILKLEIEVEQLVGKEQHPDQVQAALANMLVPNLDELDEPVVLVGVNDSTYKIIGAK